MVDGLVQRAMPARVVPLDYRACGSLRPQTGAVALGARGNSSIDLQLAAGEKTR